METINNRRSIRAYEDKPVEQEKIEKLLRAGMQAPSARNQQAWEFLVIQNKETLHILSLTSTYSRLVEKAPLVIITLGNEERFTSPENWQQGMGATTQNILLEAVEQGLGAVWIGVAPDEERMDYIRNCFGLPQTLRPFNLIAIGYPIKGTGNKFVDRYDEKKVHYEKY
ncbi:nitroreductase family protein [uncultured Sphaerochaeta sp.]|uniref:nitroreductase family protein n=1 Tax=uncultured Sphaerochaeta sp. TaxID=886478 RepID=UPI002A0A5917|nr:nitroreductase family protein [uncultured Sphaerochaeta sp.]